MNWIYNPIDLQARIYLEFIDSSSIIRMAKTNMKLNNSDYYICNAPVLFRDLINERLYEKIYPDCFKDQDTIPHLYGGDYYCIIYKFNNGEEHIINYLPFTISDSLRQFTNYVESLTTLKSFTKTIPFDRTSLIDKYRDLIIQCGRLRPPPPPIELQETVKFIPPTVIDTL